MKALGVPSGTEKYHRTFVKGQIPGEPAELLQALVSMEDGQARFQVPRLSAAVRTSYTMRGVHPDITAACPSGAPSPSLLVLG